MRPTVELRDIRTAAEKAAVLRLRRAPGQERFLGSMAEHFDDAVADARAKPRMWSVHDGPLLVGFVMISDGIPPATMAAHPDLVGPYYLWRLLIDEAQQGRGYGRATIDAVVRYLRTRTDPIAEVLWTSCAMGAGGPLPFYLRYGFVQAGDVAWDDGEPEHLLRLELAPSATTREDR
jgi:GNAT superfamily N-acetyltransferase